MADSKKNETPLVFWTKTLTGEYLCPFCDQKHLGTFSQSDIKAERVCNKCNCKFWVITPNSLALYVEHLNSNT